MRETAVSSRGIRHPRPWARYLVPLLAVTAGILPVAVLSSLLCWPSAPHWLEPLPAVVALAVAVALLLLVDRYMERLGAGLARRRGRYISALVAALVVVAAADVMTSSFGDIFESSSTISLILANYGAMLAAGLLAVVAAAPIKRVSGQIISSSAAQSEAIRPARVLVLPVSKLRAGDDDQYKESFSEDVKRFVFASVKCAGISGESDRNEMLLNSFYTWVEGERHMLSGDYEGFSWQAMLISVVYHLRMLPNCHELPVQRVILAHSRDSAGAKDEFVRLVLAPLLHVFSNSKPYRDFVAAGEAGGELVLPPALSEWNDPGVLCEAKELNFEEYECVFAFIKARVCDAVDAEQKSVSLTPICIDITGGQKPFSVAAAIATLNENAAFSYVLQSPASGHGSRLRFYDATATILGDVSL